MSQRTVGAPCRDPYTRAELRILNRHTREAMIRSGELNEPGDQYNDRPGSGSAPRASPTSSPVVIQAPEPPEAPAPIAAITGASVDPVGAGSRPVAASTSNGARLPVADRTIARALARDSRFKTSLQALRSWTTERIRELRASDQALGSNVADRERALRQEILSDQRDILNHMYELSEAFDYMIEGLCFWYEMTNTNRCDPDIYRLGRMFNSIRDNNSNRLRIRRHRRFTVREPQRNNRAESPGENQGSE